MSSRRQRTRVLHAIDEDAGPKPGVYHCHCTANTWLMSQVDVEIAAQVAFSSWRRMSCRVTRELQIGIFPKRGAVEVVLFDRADGLARETF